MKVSINSMDNDYTRYAFYLRVIKETARSLYLESDFYGSVYRIEKSSGRIFLDGKLIAKTATYTITD